jgi:formylglycine-generating enzyme required for sulfatase activity
MHHHQGLSPMENHLNRHAVSVDCPIPVNCWAWIIVFCLIFTAQTAAGQEKKITNHLGMTFIRVVPGTFLMGSPESEAHRTDNEIQRQVHIQKAFYLQQTEVTLKQWRTVMGKSWFIKREGTAQTPVTRVSFFDAQNFIRKLNLKSTARYRLPSEAEWEYACRAGTTTASRGEKASTSSPPRPGCGGAAAGSSMAGTSEAPTAPMPIPEPDSRPRGSDWSVK